MIQVSPGDVASNVSKWLELIPYLPVPQWLKSPGTDKWVLVIVTIIFTLAVQPYFKAGIDRLPWRKSSDSDLRAVNSETWGDLQFQKYEGLLYGYCVSNKNNVRMESHPFHGCVNPPIKFVAPPRTTGRQSHKFKCSNEECGKSLTIQEDDVVSNRNHAKAIVEQRLMDTGRKQAPRPIVLRAVAPIDAFKAFLQYKKAQGKQRNAPRLNWTPE